MLKIGKKGQAREEGEMSFLDHLEELRWRIIKAFSAILLFAILGMIFKTFLFDNIIYAPVKDWFPTYRLFPMLERADFNFVQIETGEAFFTHIKVSFFLGLIVAFPFVFNQFWQFIKPGLYEKERKAARGTVVVCSFLFVIGVLFGYYIIAPFGYAWLLNYDIGVEVTNSTSIASFVNYLTMFTIPTGLAFELPVVVYFLARIGLITAAGMKKFRKHSIIAILVLAALITPPDVVTQFLIGIPIYILYELSIGIAARAQKQYEKDLS